MTFTISQKNLQGISHCNLFENPALYCSHISLQYKVNVTFTISQKNLKASATAISEIVHLKLQLYLPGATKLIHLLSLFYIFSYIFFVSLSICASFKLTWWATLHQHGATCRPQYFAKVQDNILEKHVSQTCTLLYSWASPGDGGMRSLQIMLRCQVWGKCPGMSRHIAKALD